MGMERVEDEESSVEMESVVEASAVTPSNAWLEIVDGLMPMTLTMLMTNGRPITAAVTEKLVSLDKWKKLEASRQ